MCRVKENLILVLALCCGLAGFTHAGSEKKAYALEEELRLGVEYGDEHLMFAGISDFGLDSKGNMYVLDMKNSRIQIFDPFGAFLRSITISKGQGPEEINDFARMAVLPDGTIGLHDFYARKILLLKNTGDFLNSFTLEFHAHDIAAAENTLIALGFDDSRILHEIDLQGHRLASFGEPFEMPSRLSSYKEMVQIQMPMRLDTTSSGEIFLLNPFAYEIRVYKNRTLIKTITGKNPVFKPMRISKAKGGQISIVSPLGYIQMSGTLLLSSIMEIRGMQDWIGHMDIFEAGKMRDSLSIKGQLMAVDARGRLYVSEQEDIPQIVRYTLTGPGTPPR